jgi:hypothetical protein
MNLWMTRSALAEPTTSGAYQTAVDGRRIVAGDPDASYIVARMSARGTGLQMPPLGTEVVDTQGLAAVRRWIEAL